MKLLNVLILSCGTRNKLVGYFKKKENGFGRVIVTDCNLLAPALYIADKYYIVPKYKEEGYFEALIDIIKKEEIDLVIPLQEEELIIISKQKQKIEQAVNNKALIACSSYETVSLCKDKFEFYRALSSNGVSNVQTFSKDRFEECIKTFGTVILKPRFGAGSVNTTITSDEHFGKELIANSDDELIIQPFVKGIEYGVDVYRDFISHEIVSIFIKKKIRMRAGETEKSVSVVNESINDLVCRAVETVGALGQLDIDIIEQNGEYYILEMNPRFGGGYPHAYECGVNFPKMLANNCNGIKNEKALDDYEKDVYCLKYSDVVVTK